MRVRFGWFHGGPGALRLAEIAMVTSTKNGKTIAYIPCFGCELDGPDKKPCFRVRLDRQRVGDLIKHLKVHTKERGRGWFIITVTYNDMTRLKLVKGVTPGYESSAADVYLRGEILRVSCTDRSCNITFSQQDGIRSLVTRLQAVQERMRRFLEIRIPNRRREKDLIEFIPDIDLEAMESAEHEKLSQVGGALAAEVWADDDFRDWESQDG